MRAQPGFLLRMYLGGVYAAGTVALIGMLVTAQFSIPRDVVLVVVVTAALLIIGELFPIRLWRQGTFAEFAFSGAFSLALISTGPVVYAVAAQLAALLFIEVRLRAPARVVAFNVAQYALMLASARLAVCAVTGVDFGGYTPVPGEWQLLAVTVAATVYFLVNGLLHGVVTALSNGAPVVASVLAWGRSEFPVTPIVLGTAPMVVAALQSSVWMAPLCLLPIIAVRRAALVAAEHEVAALHDSLTKLPNRALLLVRLRQALGTGPPGRRAALLMLDLDHFKEINDTLGHPIGDELLQLVANRLSSTIRDRDTVARLGGDEFAVVVPDADAATAATMAQRIADSLSEPFRLADVSLNVEASVGIALSPDHGADPQALIRHADVALYTAKQNRGGYAIYDPRSDEHTVERLALMGELRHGIEHGEIVVYYQPKVDGRTGHLSGVEALVRWQHPVRGLLTPWQFIPPAENTGLIVPLTHRALDDALAALAQWRRQGLCLTVSVNVTARHVANLDLPSQVEAALSAHDLPGEVLILEVTESCLMADPARTRSVLGQLRHLGVGVSIDDFGTGYSSFANLRDLPVTEIKIDRSFVSAATTSAANAAIVKSTVELGHNLGLNVVAEGVETQQCLDVLTAMGCDTIQGYYYSPPMPAAELFRWAARRAVLVPAEID